MCICQYKIIKKPYKTFIKLVENQEEIQRFNQKVGLKGVCYMAPKLCNLQSTHVTSRQHNK